jgi:hypothetical protein
MTTRRPLVLISGAFSELPTGDSVAGATVGITASPSGLITVGSDLGIDGVAIASGEAAQVTANTALASGNAALQTIADNPGISEDTVIGLVIALS